MSPAARQPPTRQSFFIGRSAPPPQLQWPAAGGGGGGDLFVAGPTDTGFQNAAGYPGGTSDLAGTSLTNGTGITVASNTTYSYYRNLGSFGQIGTPSVPVHNVTFVGCSWENDGRNTANVVICADGPVTFSYCTVKPSGTAGPVPVSITAGYQFAFVADGTQASPGTYNSFGKAITIDHCDIWGFGNASKITGGNNTDAQHTFTSNWVHDARENTDGTDHTDGFGSPGGGTEAYALYQYNRIESLGDTNGIAYQPAPSAGAGDSVFDHLVFRNNLFGGFGNCIAIASGHNPDSVGGGTNIIFEDNTFSTEIDCALTPLYTSLTGSEPTNSWRRNRWRVPAGAAWGDPAHDGWYWLPVSDNRAAGTDDTKFVSLTDYTG